MTRRARMLIALCGIVSLFAASGVGVARAQAVVESYSSKSSLQIGMIVQLDSKQSTAVEPVTQKSAAKIHGVVVSPNDAPLSLQKSATSNQVYVATSGSYKVLVTDQNGPIRKDDYIAVSSLDGVGMKADSDQSTVVGKSFDAFDGQNTTAPQTVLKDSVGKDHTVHFGYIMIAINVAHNPYQQNPVSNVPQFLQKVGQSVASKPVSFSRVYIGMGVLAVTALIAGSVLYGGVRTGMVAIGRNPLAKRSIARTLLQIILTSLIILVLGLFAVYLLLKL